MPIINCINIIDIKNEKYELLRNAVSDERRKRADCFHFIDDSIRCVCAELLLRYSLFQEFGRLIDVEISYNKFGKPLLNGISGFSYNISHSGMWVVIAYGSSEVGIDIEQIRTVKENIADKFFSKEEQIFINEMKGDVQKKRFTQIWTLKESYIKYLGTGLSTRLDSFSVNASKGMVTNQNGDIQDNLRIKSNLFDIDYYMSVCSKDEEFKINVIKLEDLIQFISTHII